MPLLFSYGTLQLADVQLQTFGRLLSGDVDSLRGYERALVPVEDDAVTAETGMTHYANALFNGDESSAVEGTVFEVTEDELAAADEFERPAKYERRDVRLRSGKNAWVYVHAPHASGDRP